MCLRHWKDHKYRTVSARIRSRKSPGIDRMTGRMYKVIWKAMLEYIETAFSRCMNQGLFPRAWSSARVVVLLRSAHFLPCFGKVLQSVVVSRLMECFSKNTWHLQCGFTEGRGTVSAWMHVQGSLSWLNAKYVVDFLLRGSVLTRLFAISCQEIDIWSCYFRKQKA